jgi:hypothetical protein
MNMIETIKIMLDALENHTAIKHPQQIHYRDRAIEAGRQAIADFEKQEPLAWMTAHRFDQLLNGFNVMTTLTKQKAFTDDVAIYTHPYTRQPKQEPLTDEQAIDAQRYRLLRRGQYWSVIDGVGDVLRADELDAAIDAAIKLFHGIK